MAHSQPSVPVETETVLRGGAVYGAGTPAGATADVAITGGRVVAIGPDLAAGNAEVIDCTGMLVLPGLIDMHCHISYDRVPWQDGQYHRGVVAANDAGSTGVATFPRFKADVVDVADCRIVTYISIAPSGTGRTEAGELAGSDPVPTGKLLELAVEHPDVIRGVKVRVSRDVSVDKPVALLRSAVAVAREAGLPVMVHIGDSTCTLAEVLGELRAGDVVTHCFHGKEAGLVEDGMIVAVAREARERGVLFDTGHGTTQMSYRVAGTAIEQGFYPDMVSSDLSLKNWWGPAFDLITVMSKFVALGMPLADVIRAGSATSAKQLGLAAEGYGTLGVGGPAHVTVARLMDEPDMLPDSQKDEIAVRRLEPVLTLNHGRRVPMTDWRGVTTAG